MLSPLNFMPKAFKVDVQVLRGGGRDEWNNILPVTESPVNGCAVQGAASYENQPRSELADSDAVLFAPPGFTFLSTDRIRVPEGAFMAGEYSVEGVPSESAMGTHVALKRV